jgi:hypothetical protein
MRATLLEPRQGSMVLGVGVVVDPKDRIKMFEKRLFHEGLGAVIYFLEWS